MSYLEAPASAVWAGWTDEPSEGTFVDMNDYNVTIQSVGVDLWRKSEPNGDLRENCVLLDGFDFVDVNCNKKFCGICDMGESPILKLRGLCEDTVFDVHYGWTGEFSPNDSDEKYTFQGFSSSSILWDSDKRYFKLSYNL